MLRIRSAEALDDYWLRLTLSNGMTMVVPMTGTTDTAGPPANGPLNARAAAQVWGGNADAAQQSLTLTQRLERAEGDKERLAQQAQHDREMAEMRNAIQLLSKERSQPVQAAARMILSAKKGKYSATLRKRANFARSAAKWHH